MHVFIVILTLERSEGEESLIYVIDFLRSFAAVQNDESDFFRVFGFTY